MDFNKILEATGATFVPPDQVTKKYLSALLYGHMGSGKTSLASTASLVPEMSDVLMIDLENGYAPIHRHGDMSKIKIIQPHSWGELNAVFQNIFAAMENGTFPYRTVILDSLDNMQTMIYEDAKKAGKSGYDVWNIIADESAAIIRKMCLELPAKLGVSFIAITHSDKTVDEDRVIIAPSFLGKKSSKDLPQLFDMVLWCEKEVNLQGGASSEILKVYTGHPKAEAKKRGNLPLVFSGKDMRAIYTRTCKTPTENKTETNSEKETN